MSLPHALLGLIGIRPVSGYDMKKFFNRTVGIIWNADHGQIYRVLKRLADADLVEQEYVSQDGKPDKKVYSLTPEGDAELRRWLEQPIAVDDIKDRFLLWFFFSERIDKSKVRERLLEARALNEERLAGLHAVLEGKLPGASRTVLQAARLGVRYYGESIRWIDETIELIEKGEL